MQQPQVWRRTYFPLSGVLYKSLTLSKAGVNPAVGAHRLPDAANTVASFPGLELAPLF